MKAGLLHVARRTRALRHSQLDTSCLDRHRGGVLTSVHYQTVNLYDVALERCFASIARSGNLVEVHQTASVLADAYGGTPR